MRIPTTQLILSSSLAVLATLCLSTGCVVGEEPDDITLPPEVESNDGTDSAGGSIRGFEQVVLRGEANPSVPCANGPGGCSAVARYLCQSSDGINQVDTSPNSPDFDWHVFTLPAGVTMAEGITTFSLSGEINEIIHAAGALWHRARKPLEFDKSWSILASADEIVRMLEFKLDMSQFNTPRLSALTFTSTLGANDVDAVALKQTFTFVLSRSDGSGFRTVSLTRDIDATIWRQQLTSTVTYGLLQPPSLVNKAVEAQQRFDTRDGFFRQGLVTGFSPQLGVGERIAQTRGGRIQDIASLPFSQVDDVDGDCTPGSPSCEAFPPRSGLFRGIVAGQTLTKVTLFDELGSQIRDDCRF